VPLPDNPQSAWPPVKWQPYAADVTEAEAWYSGETAKLEAVYGGTAKDPVRRVKFWTRRSNDTSRRPQHRVHVPAAADIAATGADLLFGDPFTLVCDNDTTSEHLAELAEQIGLTNTLLEAAEIASGMGGVYLRPTWDLEVADHPFLSTVHPDRAVPEFRWGQLVAVTFWAVVEDTGTKVLRHLERHEPGVVAHGLYSGTKHTLGRRIALEDHPDTAAFAGPNGDGVIDLAVAYGIEHTIARYVPNVLPNRRRRGQPIGRSDTSGLEALMDGLDETMTAWVREIRLGKLRLVVPDEFLQRRSRGSGAEFDTDTEIYSPLNMDPASRDGSGIEAVQFTLRTTEYADTCRALFEQIVSSAGYSPQSFGMHGDGGTQTATEVDARESKSERTTDRKRRYWAPQLTAAAEDLLTIDRVEFTSGVDPERPRIEWPDLSRPDIRATADALNLINLAQSASIETRVRLLNPDLGPEDVDAEVGRIRDELGLTVGDPTGGLLT
jgi:A118 family predicted phage portal protein